LLHSLGKFLQEEFCRRGGDVAFRWAGDEFAVILPGASLANARLRAEVLRKQVSRLRVRHQEKTLRPVTVSIGVAALTDHGFTPELLLDAADTALMRAKRNGRNRVEVARLSNKGKGDFPSS
jgi:diguanylate cyclase (GGDEF)-like protein